jgi:hypothetical protein
VDILARAGELSANALRPHLVDANIPVMLAALRAAGRLSAADGAALAGLLERWIHFPSPKAAWLAAKTLARWGNPAAYEDARRGGRVLSILGPKAVELFVLCGSDQDAPALEALVARAPRTPALLSALGRFGHPGVWAFLLRQLGNEDLAEAAVSALMTIFGPRVGPDESMSASAWRDAIERMAPDPAIRYRSGAPWQPGVIAAECMSGELSRLEIEAQTDELAARASIDANLALCLWTPEAQPSLAVFCASAERLDGSWPRSGWG